LAAEHRQDGGIDGSHGAVGGEIAFAGEALTVGERKFRHGSAQTWNICAIFARGTSPK
jgi:hypothetical protein